MAFEELIKAGTTSKIIEVMLRDSSTGGGKTGVAHSAVTASYVREGGTRTAITLAGGAAGDSYSSGKWAEVDATNQKGIYQLHVPNAALASGVAAVTISLQASGVIDKSIRIALPAGDLMAENLPVAVNTVASGAITAAAIADGAIDNATLAADVRVKLASSQPDYAPLTAGAYTAPLDAAGTRTAVGLAAANLDSQFTAMPAAIWAVLTSSLTAVGSVGKLIVDNLNATVSSRLASSSYTAPDNAGIAAASTAASNAEAAAESAETAASTAATAAGTAATNTTTILARIGAFTGSGLNTVLGFLRAMAAKAAGLTPSDLSSGTTFSNTTDSLEANADAGGAGLTEQNIDDIATEVVGSLSGREVTIIDSAQPDGSLTVYSGDDYSRPGREISFSSDAFPSLTGASVLIKLHIGGVVYSYAGSVVSASSCKFALSSAQTGAISPGVGRYGVVATLSGGTIETIATGAAQVKSQSGYNREP